MDNYFIKTNRTFTNIRKYGWLLTVLIALGGRWEPKLGLLVVFIMAGLTGVSFFTGRYWCGNICPHGSLFDSVIAPISRNKKIPKLFKNKVFGAIFLIFFAWNFSNKIIKISPLWGTFDFLDKLGFIFSNTYLVVLIVGGIFALTINSRTWCQFCPMGSLQKISYTVGKTVGVAKNTNVLVTIESKDKCHSCGKCSRVCPFQLTPYLEFNDNNQFDNINCIKCGTCVENCPASILSIKTEKQAIDLKEKTLVLGYENRKEIEAKITKIMDLGNDLREFEFTFQNPHEVNYKAGQFILVRIMDEPKQYRAYSISSYNENNRSLKVIIKKVPKGFGTEIIFDNFKVGSDIILEGPMGDELVVGDDVKKVLFVANGIGITPFIALVKDVLLNRPDIEEVKLLNGQKFENEFIYDDYFRELSKEYDKFHYIPVASREENLDKGLRKGYVTNLIKELDVADYKVYMCGSKNMIADSYKILLDKGLETSDIFYESEEKVKVESAA